MAASYNETIAVLHRTKVTAEVCIAVAIIPLLARLWCRAYLIKYLHTDDWAIVGSWLCLCGLCGVSIMLMDTTSDVLHGGAVDLAELKALLIAGTILYMIGMALLKISLGFFFLRIFSVHRVQRYIIFANVWLVIILTIVCVVLSAATCGAWANWLGLPSQCSYVNIVFSINTAWSTLNATSDLVFTVLSLDALRKIPMRRMTKFYASLILLLGTCGGVVSLVRLIILAKNAQNPSEDVLVNAGTLTLLEPFFGVTAANLACLRPVLRLIRRRLNLYKEGSASSTPQNRSQHFGQSPQVHMAMGTYPAPHGTLTDHYLLSTTLDKDWTTAKRTGSILEDPNIQKPEAAVVKTPEIA